MSRRRSLKNKDSSEWELLIRVVDNMTLTYISALKGVYPRIVEKKGPWLSFVYASYLSSKLNPELVKSSWCHQVFGDIILVFHPDILRDLPFAICNADMHGKCMDPDLSEENQKDLLLSTGSGDLKKRPDMTFLSDWINWVLDPSHLDPKSVFNTRSNRLDPKWKRLNKFLNKFFPKKTKPIKKTLPYSHEVLFDHIPLKYIAHILTYNRKAKRSIQTYFPKIPVTVLPSKSEDQPYYYRDHVVPILEDIYKNLKTIPLKNKTYSKKRSRSRR
jgi:hypothetical protein